MKFDFDFTPGGEDRGRFLQLLESILQKWPIREVHFSESSTLSLPSSVLPLPDVRLDLVLDGVKHMRYPAGNSIRDCRLGEGALHYCPPMSWKEPCWDEFHTMSSIIYTSEFIRITWIDYQANSDLYAKYGAACFYHSAGPLSEPGQAVLRALNLLSAKTEPERSAAAVPLLRGLLELTLASFRHDREIHRGKREFTRERILNYVNANFRTPLTRQEVARKFSLNPHYVSQLFAADGDGFNATIRRLRLEYAALLLRTTTLSVDEVTVECGYQSSTFFTAAFKRFFGLPPGEFRKRTE